MRLIYCTQKLLKELGVPTTDHRVELRTDDPKLIEVLSEVRNKAKFVKKALRHYIRFPLPG